MAEAPSAPGAYAVLGSAAFVVTVDQSGLVNGLNAAQVAAADSAAKLGATFQQISQAAQQGLAGLQQLTSTLQQTAAAQQTTAQQTAAAQQQAAQAATASAAQQQQAAQQAAAAHQQASGSIVASLAETAVAFVGVTVSVEAAREAFNAIVEASKEAAQAEFQLAKGYGSAAGEMKASADALADSIGRGRGETEHALATMAVLGRTYGLTTEEIKKLQVVTADLAAVNGVSLVEASNAVTRALEGQTRGLIALQVNISDKMLKASGDLTDAQMSNFASLDPLIKARAGYNALLEQSAFAEGAAGERANDAAGAYDKMSASVTNLEEHLGKTSGALGVFSGLESAANSADKLVSIVELLGTGTRDTATELSDFGQILTAIPGPLGAVLVEIEAGATAWHNLSENIAFARDHLSEYLQLGPPSVSWAGTGQGSGGGTGGFDAGHGPIDPNAGAAEKQDDAERKEAFRASVDQRLADSKRLVDARVADIQRENTAEQAALDAEKSQNEHLQASIDRDNQQRHDSAVQRLKEYQSAEDADLTHQRVTAEAARDAQLKAAQETRDGVIASLDSQKKAADDAADHAIRALERERDAALKAASDQHDAVVKSLAAEQQDRQDQRTQQDRELQIQQQHEDRGRQAAHQAELDALAAEQQARADAFKAEHDQITTTRDSAVAAIKDQEQAERDRASEVQRHFDQQDQRLQSQHEQALRDLREQQDAEQSRHDAAVANIQREADAQTAALQQQLGALDAQDRTRSRRQTDTQNRQALTTAQQGLSSAELSGDPQAILQAQQQLAQAQDQQRQARQQRQEEDQRASIQRQIDQVKTQADTAKHAQDEQLKAVQDSTKAQTQVETDAFKAQQERIAAAKQADKDRSTALLASLQTEADAVKQTSQVALDTLTKQIATEQAQYQERTKAVNASYAQQTQDVQDARQQALWALQDQRQQEDRAFAARTASVNAAYAAEQAQVKATYDDPDTGSISRLKEQKKQADETFDSQRKAAEASYAAQTAAVKAHFGTGNADAGDGVLDKIAQTKKQTDSYYAGAIQSANTSYAQQKAAADAVFHNQDHTGILDLLDAAKKATEKTLITDEDSQVNQWKKWGESVYGTDGTLTSAKKAFDAFYEDVKEKGATLGLALPPTPDQQHRPPGQEVTPGGLPTGQSGDRPTGGGPAPVVTGAVGDTIPADDGINWTVKFPFKGKYSNPFNSAIPLHRGVDLAAPGPDNGRGTTYGAFQAGTVAALTEDPYGGHGIIIQTPGGLYNRYFHNDKVLVKSGQQVNIGDPIGVLGASGTEGFPHLHYEVSKGINGDPQGALIDPVPYMLGPAAAPETLTLKPFGDRGPSFELQATFGTAGVAGGTSTAEQVISWIEQGLQAAGRPASWADAMEHITAVESGQRTTPPGGVVLGSGDPHAKNPEAVNGEHAEGLMQMLHSTFEANRVARLPDDIFDPVANVAAAANYIAERYGFPERTPYYQPDGLFHWQGVAGYEFGGPIPKPTLLVGADDLRPYAMAGERGPEHVVPGTSGSTRPVTVYGNITMPISAGPMDAFNELSMIVR